ncbi:hypothetical protein CDAR_590961 [Caerostris darwini]|uniref:Uncharacterized protein n=1 Tax=Caerostris darwini TaxID=1538125 RepID=A0AAV4PWP6_9ARAC|nr:hypothetical protein CDAR_590961 [Caerostris darwini]
MLRFITVLPLASDILGVQINASEIARLNSQPNKTWLISFGMLCLPPPGNEENARQQNVQQIRVSLIAMPLGGFRLAQTIIPAHFRALLFVPSNE